MLWPYFWDFWDGATQCIREGLALGKCKADRAVSDTESFVFVFQTCSYCVFWEPRAILFCNQNLFSDTSVSTKV